MGAESVYVVQMRVDAEPLDGMTWQDLAEVTVPARTKRRTIIEKALEGREAEWEGQKPLILRVLDAESFEPAPVSFEEQPPKLRIG